MFSYGSWDSLLFFVFLLLIYFFSYRAAVVSSLGELIRHPSSQVIMRPCIGMLWLLLLLRGFVHQRLQQSLHIA